MSSELWAALIGAASALVIALTTQVAISRRDRGARLSERRRTALVDAQDAALAVRNSLGDYGPLARQASGHRSDAELTAARQRADDAFALLEVCLTRVDDAEIVAGVMAWLERARFHYVSLEEVTTAEESALWKAMNERFGAALTG
jgi:inorganic triphosphatase YgiF